MTPTEIIATKLFGWEQKEPAHDIPADCKMYGHPSGAFAYVGGALDGLGCGPAAGLDWPDLTDYNWIRRMEDALAERGLKKLYMVELWRVYAGASGDSQPELDSPEDCMECGIWATDAQRVAAALKVLEANA